MAENYFPSAADFDEMENHLAIIAKALTDKTEVDVSDWASVQRAVRMGIAPEVLPVGTQLVANHSVYGELVLDVVAHDHYETAEVKGGHSMTLMCHNGIERMQCDESEALYYAEEELPAGTYNFTLTHSAGLFNDIPTGTYQFTLSKPLSKGGHLRIYGGNHHDLTTYTIGAFNDPYQPIPEAYSITYGNEGISLGTSGIELNALNRVLYGSNNYKESAIRQYLNSTADEGKVWTPQSKYDVHPNWLDSYAGFANGLDKDLLAVIGEVKVPCVANDVYESLDSTTTKGQKYTVNDKFYLASVIEIMGKDESTIDDGSTQLLYFKDASSIDLVKNTLSGGLCDYTLRTPSPTETHDMYQITNQGRLRNIRAAFTLHDIVPMFNIV